MRIVERDEAGVGELCFLGARVDPGITHVCYPVLREPEFPPPTDVIPPYIDIADREYKRTRCVDDEGNRFIAWRRIR